MFLLILLLLFACSKTSVDQYYDIARREPSTKSFSNQNEYVVSLNDVKCLLGNQKGDVTITCYPSDNEPLLYVVALNPGFIIISGDKRASPLVAYSISSSIASNTSIELFILDEYSDPIRSIKQSSLITDEMKNNISFWDILSAYGEEAELSLPLAIENTIDGQRFITHIGPLLETEWGQSDKNAYDHYWNEYCPWSNSSLSGAKSPVGCVAVAAGQFAYYMKDRDSVQVRIPTWASCMGYVSNYVQSFSPTLSVSMIDEMPLNYSTISPGQIENARIFLAYIGNQIGAIYGQSSTRAYTSNLPYLFDIWGIDSDYVQFSDSLAIEQLTSYTPVITRGTRSGGFGHCWVIDGYDEDIIIPWPIFSSIEDETCPSTMFSNNHNSRTTLDVQISKQYHMNWGWDGSYNGWFSIDNWTVAGREYSINKHMIKVN